MRNNIYNKQVRNAEREAKLKMDLYGEGVFLYENNTSGDLFLPKPALGGRRTVAKGSQFQGDSYFMQLVKSNQLKLIKTIIPKSDMKENKMEENKLILDQPDKFTLEGKVESVTPKESSKKKLNENKFKEKNKPTLINENPIGDIEVVNE